MVVSIMIVIMAVMVAIVRLETVQLQILLLSQFLREFGQSELILTRRMAVVVMMSMRMGMAPVIAVMVSMRLMSCRWTRSRMRAPVPDAQIKTKSEDQHSQDLPIHN